MASGRCYRAIPPGHPCPPTCEVCGPSPGPCAFGLESFPQLPPLPPAEPEVPEDLGAFVITSEGERLCFEGGVAVNEHGALVIWPGQALDKPPLAMFGQGGWHFWRPLRASDLEVVTVEVTGFPHGFRVWRRDP